MTESTINIYTDGGSRGNPGPAAIGVVFFDSIGKKIFTYKKFIGRATNNEAEYSAILRALKILDKSKWFQNYNQSGGKVVCHLDSQLVVKQLCGRYKVKQPHIKKFIDQICTATEHFKLELSFIDIPREKNKEADKLVNEALDEEKAKNGA